MDAFCAGRTHDSFENFYKYFVPSVVGKTKFKARMDIPGNLDSAMCTVSDEACALLLLENNYDRWTDVHKNKIEGSTIADPALEHSDDKRKRKWESNVSPKYTDGGIIYTDNRTKSHKGWKDAGIQRFNHLCLLVGKDRSSNPEVVPALVQKWKTSGRKRKQTEPVLDIPRTEAYHELWDDEPMTPSVAPTTPNQFSRGVADNSPLNNTSV
jgi:hypothetical protein